MNKLASKLPQTQFFAKNGNSIWLASTFKLHRNLKTHFFPHKLNSDFLADLTQMLKTPLMKSSLLKKGSFFSMKDLKPDDRTLLYEYFIPKEDYRAYHSSEGLIVEASKHIHALINTEDHLILHLIDTKNLLEEAWHVLLSFENELSKEIEFAFSQRFGFLTSDLKKCGTGLEISLIFHLPALIQSGEIVEHLEKIQANSIQVSSFFGEKESYLGDLILISNKQKINLSEEQIIKSLHSCALTLMIAEKKKREEILRHPNHALKNDVSKAFGTLKHACQLDVKEALSLISLCKLGVELKWIKNITSEAINELFFSLRKGILQIKNKGSKNDLSEFRSSYIKEVLAAAKL